MFAIFYQHWLVVWEGDYFPEWPIDNLVFWFVISCHIHPVTQQLSEALFLIGSLHVTTLLFFRLWFTVWWFVQPIMVQVAAAWSVIHKPHNHHHSVVDLAMKFERQAHHSPVMIPLRPTQRWPGHTSQGWLTRQFHRLCVQDSRNTNRECYTLTRNAWGRGVESHQPAANCPQATGQSAIPGPNTSQGLTRSWVRDTWPGDGWNVVNPFTPKFKKYILPTFLKSNVWVR